MTLIDQCAVNITVSLVLGDETYLCVVNGGDQMRQREYYVNSNGYERRVEKQRNVQHAL